MTTGLGDGLLGAYGATLGDLEGSWILALGDVLIGEAPIHFDRNVVDLGGVEDLRADVLERPLRHGLMSVSGDFLGGRSIEANFLIVADTATAAQDQWERLVAAWSPAGDELVDLTIQSPSRTWIVKGKPRRCVATGRRLERRSGVIRGRVQFLAFDPILYDAIERDVLCDLETPAAGIGLPLGFPFGWGGGAAVCALPNEGTAHTWPVAILTASTAAPLIDPTITDLGSGELLGFELEVPAGWSLVIDMGEATVILVLDPTDLSTGASRSASVRRPESSWLSIPPGGTTWQIVQASGAGSISARWRDAWY